MRQVMKAALLCSVCAFSASAQTPVTIENFVRAETDFMLTLSMKANGFGVGELFHNRAPVTAESQTVIRSNQDTLYSSYVADLSQPVTVVLPEIGGRYMSMHVINQDHFMFVESEPGAYRLTQDEVGTRYALLLFRTFVDVNDPEDLSATHAAQDAIEITGGAAGAYEAPDWDVEALQAIRSALNEIALRGFVTTYAFGTRDETRPIDHLIGAASGWGGLPQRASTYIVGTVPKNDGQTVYQMVVPDVPVRAFWSVTVYNKDGYLDPGRASFNSVSATAEPDGSTALQFGQCETAHVPNCLPVADGWNYTVRLYEPEPAILEGRWTFPEPTELP